MPVYGLDVRLPKNLHHPARTGCAWKIGSYIVLHAGVLNKGQREAASLGE